MFNLSNSSHQWPGIAIKMSFLFLDIQSFFFWLVQNFKSDKEDGEWDCTNDFSYFYYANDFSRFYFSNSSRCVCVFPLRKKEKGKFTWVFKCYWIPKEHFVVDFFFLGDFGWCRFASYKIWLQKKENIGMSRLYLNYLTLNLYKNLKLRFFLG